MLQTKTDEAYDLDKLTKFLALKSAQIIMQSRLGEKLRTECQPPSRPVIKNVDSNWDHVDKNGGVNSENNSGTNGDNKVGNPTDYKNYIQINFQFGNIPTPLADALEVAKTALNQGGPKALPAPLCVEVSLSTIEGEKMVLETWCIGVDAAQKDTTFRIAYTVYNRMGILLKSLVSVTRVTPAYKLSRRQSPDSYFLSSKIYIGEPKCHHLGEGYSQARVGQLATTEGTIYVMCYYRTKMAFSPQASKDGSIMWKSDHFRQDMNPKNHRFGSNNEESINSLRGNFKFGPFGDKSSLDQWKTDEEDIPFAALLKNYNKPAKHKTSDPPQSPSPPQEPSSPPEPSPPQKQKPSLFSKRSPPLVQQDSENGNLLQNNFVFKEVKTPFATICPSTDLSSFFKECHYAPRLQGSGNEPTVAGHVGDLTQQLRQFEVSLQEYDNVVTELSALDNNN